MRCSFAAGNGCPIALVERDGAAFFSSLKNTMTLQDQNSQLLMAAATRPNIFPGRPVNLVDLPSVQVAGFLNSATDNERALCLWTHDTQLFALQLKAECHRLFVETRDALGSLSESVDTITLLPGPQGDKGDKGDPGADSTIPGPPGRDSTVPGPRGLTGPQGPGLVWRGPWSRKTLYKYGDVTEYDGSSYICVASTTKAQPPSRQWDLLAAAGLDGKNPKRMQSSVIFLPPSKPHNSSQVCEPLSPLTRAKNVWGPICKGTPVFIWDGEFVPGDICDIDGLATEDSDIGDTIEITKGSVTSEDWTPVAGTVTLQPNTIYYSSATEPGTITPDSTEQTSRLAKTGDDPQTLIYDPGALFPWRGWPAAPNPMATKIGCDTEREITLPTEETIPVCVPVTIADGKVVRATTATLQSAQILGLLNRVIDDQATVQIDGIVTATAEEWGGVVAGGLTAGQTYFLSADGGLTATAPLDGYISQVGWALSATQLKLVILPPMRI